MMVLNNGRISTDCDPAVVFNRKRTKARQGVKRCHVEVNYLLHKVKGMSGADTKLEKLMK